MKLITYLKTQKKCDLISFAGVVAFIILALSNALQYAVLANPVAFIAAFTISVIFLLTAFIAWRTRLSVIWLAMGVGSIVLFMCSNIIGFFSNLVYLFQIILSFACGIAALVFQLLEKANLLKTGFVFIGCFTIIAVFAASFWGGSVALVNGKKTPAQKEFWAVPDMYDQVECPQPGKLEHIEYQTKAYATDSRTVTKSAYVYLPYNYDANKQYNILYLMHGTGDDEEYWLIKNGNNKTMIDNLIYYGDIKPLIIVTPTWYVDDDCTDDLDKLTYSFKDELRNDLMPFIESKYSTYAEVVTAEAFTASREHRAFAGLSRGSATTWHSAINGSLDYFSWFGCFSGCLTTEDEFLQGFQSEGFKDYSINYLYNTSGSFDFLLNEHLTSYRRLLEIEERLTEGKNCSFEVFPTQYHSINSWHIALYNCLQLFF